MRTVFNNKELAHVWAQQKQESGRGSNMFFNGKSIFSYGAHYKIAQFHGAIVLVNSNGYSISTAKHTNYVRRAISHLRSFEVPNVENPKAPENLTYLSNNIVSKIDDLLRCQLGYEGQVKSIHDSVNEFNQFVEFFNIQHKKLELCEDFTGILYAIHEVKLTKRDAKDAARRKENKLAAAMREADFKESVENWMNFNGQIKGYSNKIFLRINLENREVETSQGARVPLDAAKQLAVKILKGENVEGTDIGHYTVNHVGNGEVVIGCHRIPLSEVKRVFQGVL